MTASACCFQQLMTPCNTPATPPNFPDALAAFSRLSTTGSPGGAPAPPVSPLATHPPPPPQVQMQVNTFSGPPNSQNNYASISCSTAVSHRDITWILILTTFRTPTPSVFFFDLWTFVFFRSAVNTCQDKLKIVV